MFIDSAAMARSRMSSPRKFSANPVRVATSGLANAASSAISTARSVM
jgi:hypothetical protein